MDNLKNRVVEDNAVLAMSSFLRFPLMVLVVLSHAYIAKSGGAPFAYTSFIISKIIGNMVVPCFFVISGYLFFRNVEGFSFSLYRDKLWRRVKSLVLPYIIWNGLVLLLYFIGQSLVPHLFSGANTRVADYSLLDFVKAFWIVDGTQSPINPPLWYIRDLMVLVLLSPVIHFVLSKRWMGVVFMLLMLGLWLSGDAVNSAVVWLQPKSIFLFSLGGWYALHKVEVVKFRWWLFAVGLALCGVAVVAFFLSKGFHWQQLFCYEVAILSGTMTILYAAYHLAGKRGLRIPDFLSQSNFFIYVFHYIPLALLLRVLVKFVTPTTDVGWFAIYFGSFAVILAVSVAVFHLINRLLPKTTTFILGNRV